MSDLIITKGDRVKITLINGSWGEGQVLSAVNNNATLQRLGPDFPDNWYIELEKDKGTAGLGYGYWKQKLDGGQLEFVEPVSALDKLLAQTVEEIYDKRDTSPPCEVVDWPEMTIAGSSEDSVELEDCSDGQTVFVEVGLAISTVLLRRDIEHGIKLAKTFWKDRKTKEG